MTNRQIEVVQNSWTLVAAMDAQVVGSLFYNRLFEIAPEVRPMFRHGSLDEQSRKLLSMLNYVISKLQKLDDIIDEVRKLARRHVHYGVKDEHYAQVGAALLWTLEAGLAGNWNNEVKQAWVCCYTTLAGAMIEAANMPEAVLA